MSATTGFHRAQTDVPPQFVGVPQVTLQQWLTDGQQALQDLSTGNKPTVVLYNSGEGSRSVTYTRTNQSLLEARIRDLARALGLSRGRRAIGVRF